MSLPFFFKAFGQVSVQRTGLQVLSQLVIAHFDCCINVADGQLIAFFNQAFFPVTGLLLPARAS